MNCAIDEQGLTFSKFVDCVIPKCRPIASLSFVNPQETYRVMLVGKVKIGKEFVQSFDEHYLQPIAQKLGLNLTKTAKLVALRNAWIAYFQDSEISLALVKENQSLTLNEIVRDYVVLTSHKWTEHPRFTIGPYVFPEDDDCVSFAECWDNHQWQQWWLSENDRKDKILSSIDDFRKQKGAKVYTSLLEKNADYAANDIKLAKNRIQELHCAIEEQEEIIRAANRPIRKFQNSETLKKKAPGHPKIAEMQDQKQRRDMAMEYVRQWVDSLMSYLSITSRAELARMVGGQKMTWGRWLNKETLPSSRVLKSLLDVKIKSDQHPNTKLRDIQTSPSLIDLITLVDLV